MSMNHDEYIDLSVDNIDDTEDIEFDTYNDEIRINPVLKTHLDDGDKLVWYKDPTIIATWHSNGRLDVPCFDATDVTISAVNFRILKGHWRTKDEHGVGTESNHWLYDDKPISEYLDLYPDFWKANEIKAVQPKKERKPRQKEETSDKSTNIILPRQNDIVREYKYESEKHLYDSNYSDTYPDKLRKQATPSWVAEDMIDLLPNEVWRTDSKFLDIYCKSGIFLEIIIDRLMKKVDYSSIGLTSDREIRQYIIENQVYAICWNKWYLDLSRKAINGKSSMVGNIYCIGSEIENMTEDRAKAVLENDKAQSSIDKTLLGIDIRKEFFKNMQIDVVVGNPPYNNDIYIPFVEMGHNLASQCSVFITPAKWQAKGGEKNEAFRQNIVPHMSKIVYYPCTEEIFDITEVMGITYYLLNSSSNNNGYTLKIKTKRDDVFHKEETINVHIGETRFTIFDSRLEQFCRNVGGGARLYNKMFNTTGEYRIRQCHQPHDKRNSLCCGGYVTTPTYIEKNDTKVDGNYYIVTSGNEDYCNYFSSYINTKFVRFCIALGLSGSVKTKETWRFVPDPGDFNKIFEDKPLSGYIPDKNGEYIDSNGKTHCSLYKKYNLTDDEINIIESVIKERK